MVSLRLCLMEILLMSLKKIFQSTGPRTVPWYTILEMVKVEEEVPWRMTLACRGER